MMNDFIQFGRVGAWRAALGLLPIPLRDTADNQERYVLLNGTTGNFCLDLAGGIDSISQRIAAWSCDVGHYVTCVGDSVVVNRWEREAREETYTSRSVLSRLHEFHRHLEKTEPDRSRSVITHVLRIFHLIRAVVSDERNGLRSLRILLHLLASAAAGEENLLSTDLEKWGLTPEILEASQPLTETTWRPLFNDLSGIGRYNVPRPDFQLVIAHASGAIFQEAHLEAMLSLNSWFPGLEGPASIDSRATPAGIGIYFTAPALARTLAEEATNDLQGATDRTLLMFDPACGSGELLKECLRLLKLQNYPGRVRIIGWDKSPASVDMARFVMAREKATLPDGQVEVEVTLHDSLTEAAWPDAIDILIMNPPFKAWGLMGPEEKEVMTKLLGSSTKPNLAMAFASRALGVLRDGGTLAMITPNSLLEALSGRHVRKMIAEMLTPQLIARLGDQNIFSRALVDAGMYVGKKKPNRPVATAILWADSRSSSLNQALRGLRKWRGAEIEPIKGEGFSVYRRSDIGRTADPWMARDFDAWVAYEKARRNDWLVPAKQLFDIRQGVRLGNDVFVVSKEYFHRLPKLEQKFFRPAVMNLSISEAQLEDSYYVFYRYTKGLPPIKSDRDLEKHVPTYFKQLFLPAKRLLSARRSLVRDHKDWWELLEHRAWQEGYGPKLVSKYFGGSRSFAIDRQGKFVVVVGNAWLVRKGAIQLDITDEEVYLATLAYLSSDVADELLKYVSIQVSGGQLDLSNKYLGELLIPDPAKLKSSEVSSLIEMGMKISEGNIDNWAVVNELVYSILNR